VDFCSTYIHAITYTLTRFSSYVMYNFHRRLSELSFLKGFHHHHHHHHHHLFMLMLVQIHASVSLFILISHLLLQTWTCIVGYLQQDEHCNIWGYATYTLDYTHYHIHFIISFFSSSHMYLFPDKRRIHQSQMNIIVHIKYNTNIYSPE